MAVGRLRFLAVGAVVACGGGGDSGSHGPPPSVTTADVCDPNGTLPLALHFDPPTVAVAPGAARPARLVVDPDVCAPSPVTFASDGAAVVDAPAGATLDHVAELAFDVVGKTIGRAKIVATIKRPGDGATASAELAVDVREPRVPTCSPSDPPATAVLSSTSPSLAGTGALALATVSAPLAAFTRTDVLAMPTAALSIGCGADLGPNAVTPAVSFAGPAALMAKPLRREIAFSLPIEPAALPRAARLRHLRVWYTGPRATKPRSIAVTGARIVASGDGYALTFSSPWLGTYQAAFDPGAGEKHVKRHVVHRALLGISMGAGGAATFGVGHPDMFDSIAMLGGPIDWRWLLWYVERYAMGGFCAKGAPCATTAPDAYPIDEPFVHTMDFDHIWNEEGKGGGGVSRSDTLDLLTDLTIARGNPLGENAEIPFLAAGPKKSDPFVVGAPLAGQADCSIALHPIAGDPDQAAQAAALAACNRSRCDASRRYVVPHGYFDGEYNPDGTEQVISFCDGKMGVGASPYRDVFTTTAPGEGQPVGFALAVDLNKNGVRDPGEPVIRAAHEPYGDVGVDGLPDALEPGYDAANNPDPAQDDYDPQINPTGTEGDHRWEPNEPFRDVGLDGVPNTAQTSAIGDVGEGDGKYTEAAGIASFRAIDPDAVLRGVSPAASGTFPNDDAFARLRIWSDGGVRDFMNFARVGDHFHGAMSTRLGTMPRGATFGDAFERLPGASGEIQTFEAAFVRWADIPRVAGVRYGDVDATPAMIGEGDGQHVGTGGQILARISSAFTFIGQGWPDADRARTEDSSANATDTTRDALGIDCEIAGYCRSTFAGPKSGRTAPVTVVFPPGYAHVANKDKRYPVVYVLHGYGQQESDVTALAVLTLGTMNDARRSYAHRLPKFIVVYVDGRCRMQNGRPDCVQGSFFLDSPNERGPRVSTWMEELVAWVDASFRTLPPADVDDIE